MRTYYHPNETDSKAASTQSEEDPPNNLTKQNNPGGNNDDKTKVDVPEEALKHYKENAEDTEE